MPRNLAFISGCLTGLLLLLMPAVASAQPGSFSTMDRAGTVTRGGIDMGLQFPDVNIPVGFGLVELEASLRMDLHAHVILQRFKAGGYATLPMSALFLDGPPGLSVDNEFVLGNIELGGLYVLRSGQFAGIFRLGFALPTGPDGSNLFETQAAVQSSLMRITDLALGLPDSSWLRFGISGMSGFRRGLFWRVDLGVDVPLSEPDGGDLDPILRANFGAGYRLRKVALMAELTNIFTEGFLGADDDLASNFSGSIRYAAGTIEPSIALVLPLSSSLRDAGMDFGILFGVQVTNWLN